jgi:hypothetical protein
VDNKDFLGIWVKDMARDNEEEKYYIHTER